MKFASPGAGRAIGDMALKTLTGPAAKRQQQTTTAGDKIDSQDKVGDGHRKKF